MFKKVFTLFLALLFCVPFAFAQTSKQPKTIAFIMSFSLVARWQRDQAGFIEQAKALGDTPIVVSSEGDAQRQTNQVDSMINRGVDAIVLAPVNTATAPALFAKIQAAGIRAINYNFIAPNANPDYIIGRNPFDFGEIQAKLALQAKPSGNYILLGGDPGTSVAQDTTNGNLSILKPQVAAGRIKIVSQKFNIGWNPSSAQQQVEEVLIKTNNDVAAILSNNDGMAIGAMQALKSAGLLGKVYISGVDADTANLQAIAQGNQASTMWNDFAEMGRLAALAADTAARGEKLTADKLKLAVTPGTPLPQLTTLKNGKFTVPIIYMPVVAVTSDNLKSWLNDFHWADSKDVFGTD